MGDISNINCRDSIFANRIWIQTGPSQHRFELGIILEEITGPQDSEWGIERLKRCLNRILANKMRNVREPLGLVNREVSDVLNLCLPSYRHRKQTLCQLVGHIADQQGQLVETIHCPAPPLHAA